MFDAIVSPPRPINEPVLSYAPHSPERAALKAELARQSAETIEIPMVIGGREITTGELMYRWIDELTSKYNVDPDITVLLDSTEV